MSDNESSAPYYDDISDYLREPEENPCPHCGGDGQVPTMDYESYFGAQMKPCPACCGVLDGLGHGPLS